MKSFEASVRNSTNTRHYARKRQSDKNRKDED